MYMHVTVREYVNCSRRGKAREEDDKKQQILFLIRHFGGHCIKKSEPISSRTPDFARSACLVA